MKISDQGEYYYNQFHLNVVMRRGRLEKDSELLWLRSTTIPESKFPKGLISVNLSYYLNYPMLVTLKVKYPNDQQL